MIRDAVISECGQFRYRLIRVWDVDLPRLAFVMLNPSTADASQDDPTIRKCIGFAKRLGFGGIFVVNLYAFRATDPAMLRKQGYLVGPKNDAHIGFAAWECETLICAWGANARGLARPGEVLDIIKRTGRKPMALRILAGNVPAHPLMLPYSCTLEPMP